MAAILSNMKDMSPKNSLETALVEVRAGSLSTVSFLRVMLESKLAIPSNAEIKEDGSGFQPTLLEKENKVFVACFSDMDRAKEIADPAPYCIVMSGKDFLTWLPTGYGIVVNHGYESSVEISPEGIQQVLKDFVSVPE